MLNQLNQNEIIVNLSVVEIILTHRHTLIPFLQVVFLRDNLKEKSQHGKSAHGSV